MLKIKKGDTVEVLSGKDKGKRGKVQRVLPRSFQVVVEGVNIHKKHTRPKQAGQKGALVEFAAPLPIAKVSLICPACGKKSRVGILRSPEGAMRMCKKCQQTFV